ncbi:hypothetical protein [Paracidovorax anthurii]|nr:hypothetical protein [Paracidovorax anthurii]
MREGGSREAAQGVVVSFQVRSASGQVVLQGLQAVRIEWSDGDHFQRVL